jgi:hypothetical protein
MLVHTGKGYKYATKRSEWVKNLRKSRYISIEQPPKWRRQETGKYTQAIQVIELSVLQARLSNPIKNEHFTFVAKSE